MQAVFLEDDGVKQFINEDEYAKMCKKIEKAHDMLEKKNGKGKERFNHLMPLKSFITCVCFMQQFTTMQAEGKRITGSAFRNSLSSR